MSLHDDLLTAAAYLEGDGVSMEAAEADRIAGVFRSYATALCQQGERDAKRLEWIASQGDEFSSGILQDSPGDGDYYVNGMNDAYGTGKTFRDAIDAAKGKTE